MSGTLLAFMELSRVRNLTRRQITTEQGDKKRQEGILTGV
jgi:hypothetical protein